MTARRSSSRRRGGFILALLPLDSKRSSVLEKCWGATSAVTGAPIAWANSTTLTLSAFERCCMWRWPPVAWAIIASRAAIEYSATPVAPQTLKCSRAMCSLSPRMPFNSGSSSWRLIKVPRRLASSKAWRTTLVLCNGIPSSEKPTAPACNKPSKSVRCWPSKFLVTVATVLTWMASLAAESKTSFKVTTSEIVGVVLAIMTTVVKPPAAAARAPVWISSLWVWPGSRKWTWMSTKPGATTLPLTSITCAPS